MNIACIGTGFVGVVTSAVFAKLGNHVTALDIDEAKIAKLKQGIVPFYEPNLSELLLETQQTGNLSFTTDYSLAIKNADIIMIMVGTPSKSDGSADLTFVESVTSSIAPFLKENAVIVVKSTVPPGTNESLKSIVSKATTVPHHFASVPEFLKEGTAVSDTLHPDRVVIGAESSFALEILTKLHSPLTSNIISMSPSSAQMTKYAANNYLATRITFINQIADLCETSGADIEDVMRGIGSDKRIGSHYWYPGLGYGGSCFPKDVKELASYAASVGENESLFITIDDRNSKRIPKLMQKYEKLVGGFSGKTVAVLGLSFKPNTNDTRVAPSLAVIPWLIDHGAIVKATDPQTNDEIKPLLPSNVEYFNDPYQAIEGSSVIFHLVEWQDYGNLDFTKITALMVEPKFYIDTRNQYDPKTITAAGIKYKGIGR